ncbi:flagellar basal body-associated FliL family protein [Chelativorans salis]|uniref:Flagellar protein FliL n=1 Tax=Chelativorans salis TaxID=2978478 RepID=A0ABT2LSR4_9HYPH|nr:flagellar basal body-associated FliL family protein [Chelativorans sp. EGI FJ00035]MCT7377572.1 flagellar basal body-associated FliL family protein [Chelativorans sp. EGI FJ00035]
MALVPQEEQKKGPSPLVQVAALLTVTALAVGMGWYTGGYLEGHQTPVSEPGTIKDQGHAKGVEEQPDGESQLAPSVTALDPITTNLADPTEVWVRMELAIAFDGEPDQELAHTIHQDLLAYMRTVKLRQIESASGFQYLKADLRERARIRSEGRVSDVLVITFLYE